jgi:HEAT repeat protein
MRRSVLRGSNGMLAAAAFGLLLLAALPGCRGAATKPAPTNAPSTQPTPPTVPPGSTPVPDDPRAARLQRVDLLISQWDAAQSEGRNEQAQAIFDRIRAEVDAGFQDFVDASSGKFGVRLQYLGTAALGYSSRPEATRVLVERLDVSDARLVGNALIALKLRADPDTPLSPILRLIPTSAPEPRRYAPLALANVLEARQRAGRPRDPATERAAINLLSGVVADRDPFVRLHTAKALGFLYEPGAYELLGILLKDEHIRIRVAAAASLERLGDPRGFGDVIRVLSDAPEESKPVVRDILASYAGRLQGRPLTAQERDAFGTSAIAWERWYQDYVTKHGGTVPAGPMPPAPDAAAMTAGQPMPPGQAMPPGQPMPPGQAMPPVQPMPPGTSTPIVPPPPPAPPPPSAVPPSTSPSAVPPPVAPPPPPPPSGGLAPPIIR